MQLQDALGLFLAQLRADGRSRHTIAQYRRHVGQLARWGASIGLSCEIEEIDHVVLARFLGSPEALLGRDGAEKMPVSVNALRTSLRVFGAYLADADYLPKNPARLIKRGRGGPAPPRGLSKGEQAALFETLAAATTGATRGRKGAAAEAQRDHALFALLLATGIRVGSAVALDVADLDLDEGVMDVRVVKGGHPQRVQLGEETAEHLGRFVGQRESGPVFVGRGGMRLSTRHARRRFGEWVQAAGIKRRVVVHELRHTFALAMYERTRDVFAVQRALGHRSIASTVGYASGGPTVGSGHPFQTTANHRRDPSVRRGPGPTQDERQVPP